MWCCPFSKKTNKTTASIVNGALVLTAPDAVTPIVWQIDLSKMDMTSIEIVQDEKKDISNLSFQTPSDKTKKVIAGYVDPQAASAALMALSDALQRGEANNAGKSCSGGGGVFKWIKRLFFILGGLFLIFLALGFILRGVSPTSTTEFTPESSSGSAPPAAVGVPMSADDFLRGN